MEPVRGDSAAEISNADENGFDWINTCYLCGLSCVRDMKRPSTSKNGRVSVVSKAENMREKTLLVCKYRGDEWGSEVQSRLEKVNDLRVVKAHYHLNCFRRFMGLQGKQLLKYSPRPLGGRPTDDIVEKKMANFYKACEQLKVRVGDCSLEVAAEINHKMKEMNDDPNYLYKITNILQLLKKRRIAKPNPEEDTLSMKDIYFEPRIKRKISTKKVSFKDPSDKKEDSEESVNDSGDDFVYEPYVKRRYKDPSKKLRRESAQQPDRKTLVIKNLPESATEEDVRELSSDIKELRLDRVKYGEEKNMRYAVISFKDEFTAEQNYISLMGLQVRGTNVIVEYSNCRSVMSYMRIRFKPSTDPKKLVVTGFGREFNEIRPLKKMFPASTDISIPINPADNRPFGFAFIQFPDEESARVAHDTTQDYVFQERLLVVMYAKKSIQETDTNAVEQQDEHLTGLEIMNGLLNTDENNENGRELEEIQNGEVEIEGAPEENGRELEEIQNGEVEIEGAPEERMTEDEELNGILSELGVEVLDEQRDDYIDVLL